MNRLLAAAGVAVALLLAGCSAPAESGTASATPAPALTAATPEADETVSGEDQFLQQVRDTLRDDTQIPDATDEQLLDAGEKACQEIAAGTDTNALSLIDGETPNGAGYYNDSRVIIGAAKVALCG